MATRGASTNTTVPTAAAVMTWSVTRRRQLMGGMLGGAALTLVSGISPRRLAPGYGPHQQLCHGVHDDRYKEQGQSNLDQGRQIKVASRFAELIGENAGHGVSRGKQRLDDLGVVADDHGDGHSLAQSPP